MKLDYKAFVFEGYEFFLTEKKILLSYSFDSKVFFEEEFILDFEFLEKYSEEALDSALFGLWVMAGVSYFKAALPREIKFKTGGLNASQKVFFEKVYLQGLGEFFYTNGINPLGVINFPEPKMNQELRIKNQEDVRMQNFASSKILGSIVPIGGGKDSLVTAEMLREAGEDFETFVVKPTPLLDHVCEKIGKNQLRVFRKISPQLLELNKKGVLNGHVPITAILSFLSVVTAILRGKKSVIFSNEASAGEGNTEFHGVPINHQYSKTLEFEKDFQQYVKDCIHPEIEYFSLLRPLSELKIAQIFCSKVFQKYKHDFSSCNRNFHFGKTSSKYQVVSSKGEVYFVPFMKGDDHEEQKQFKESGQGVLGTSVGDVSDVIANTPLSPPLERGESSVIWCGKCPKCAFVFAIFSPFLSREELVGLFGKNLFADSTMDQTFRELLGQEGIKPFECVGEVEEVRKALSMAKQRGDWPELKENQKLKIKNQKEGVFEWGDFREHVMPERFEKILKKFA